MEMEGVPREEMESLLSFLTQKLNDMHVFPDEGKCEVQEELSFRTLDEDVDAELASFSSSQSSFGSLSPGQEVYAPQRENRRKKCSFLLDRNGVVNSCSENTLDVIGKEMVEMQNTLFEDILFNSSKGFFRHTLSNLDPLDLDNRRSRKTLKLLMRQNSELVEDAIYILVKIGGV